ncbi:MAG TPA: hypothetical protein VIU16_06955, partial [Gaiellaceae bacterium]
IAPATVPATKRIALPVGLWTASESLALMLSTASAISSFVAAVSNLGTSLLRHETILPPYY